MYLVIVLDFCIMRHYLDIMQGERTDSTALIPMPGPEGFVTVQAVARYFQIAPATVTKWRKGYGLPSYRFTKGRRGGTVLFKMSEVIAWARTFRQGGVPRWTPELRPTAS